MNTHEEARSSNGSATTNEYRPPEISSARLGPLVVDFERREIRWSARERCEISETESAVLSFLIANQWRAVSREELLADVWGIRDGVETRTIDMHIARLRMKLRGPWNRKTPVAIITVRSQGYMAGPDWQLLRPALSKV